jgi:hypothetical protein
LLKRKNERRSLAEGAVVTASDADDGGEKPLVAGLVVLPMGVGREA